MSNQRPKPPPSNTQVILFIVMLSFVCALVLSILASILKKPQEIARELDRSQQMLIASKIITHDENFLLRDEEGKYSPAKYVGNGILAPGSENDWASSKAIMEVYKRRLIPYLVDGKGNILSFAEARLNMNKYLANYKKTGYYKQPLKLIYEILPNSEQEEEKPIGYVIPINGYGLWDAIYGYLAVEPDGVTVIGISWYEHKETPGLGANISDEPWQSQFPGKQIFLPSPSGEIDLRTSPLGITVVKGKVVEVLGDVPKAKAAVDGMPGASLTGNGVTKAYRDVLEAYRPFFLKLHNQKR